MTTMNSGVKIADEVWQQVVQYIQLAMLTGTDVADYLRLIKVRLNVETNEHVLGDGQTDLFNKQINELLAKVDELSSNNVEIK